jgi:hypothetical protein
MVEPPRWQDARRAIEPDTAIGIENEHAVGQDGNEAAASSSIAVLGGVGASAVHGF